MSQNIPTPFVFILITAARLGITHDRAEVSRSGRNKELVFQREGNGYLCTMVFRLEKRGKISSKIYLERPDGESECLQSIVADFDQIAGLSLAIFKFICGTYMAEVAA